MNNTKPTLGLQPRKVWKQLRSYEIVKALHRQVENNEKLSLLYVMELHELLKELEYEYGTLY